ncbi:MAG: SEC-C metal-binding domain-containing protein [Bacillota bacterium]|nr:SEC-C metal-binding domain-containing protein [Bacillota bacterium]
MTNLFITKGENLGEFSLEEGDKGFNTVLNEHPEVKTLFGRRDYYPETLTINGVNPLLHVMIEGIIENQLQSQSGVQDIYSKLQNEQNLTPHAARACIANVFLHHFSEVLIEHQPFDQETFVRRLSLIGTDVSKLNRNDRCPCGSGAKFKRCCSSYAESFIVSPLAGRMDLGHESYIFNTPVNIEDPLDPIFQLEARYQIAKYMESHQDLDGAVKVLKENIAQAETHQGGKYSENAWQDYIFFCQNHEQLDQEFLYASDHLISLTNDDEQKGNVICDKADFLAKKGDIETAETEYTNLFVSMPDYYFYRYRYALMLSVNDRDDDAIKVLTDLITIKEIDERTHREAFALLEILGVDTSALPNNL